MTTCPTCGCIVFDAACLRCRGLLPLSPCAAGLRVALALRALTH